MDQLAAHVLKFQDSWPIWKIQSLDENRRSIVLNRTDEFPMTIVIAGSKRYPNGETIITGKEQSRQFSYVSSGEEIGDAIENALMSWESESQGNDFGDSGGCAVIATTSRQLSANMFSTSHESYEDAVRNDECGVGRQRSDEEWESHRRHIGLFHKRWTKLSRMCPGSSVALDKQRQCFSVMISIPLRDSPMRCIALGIQNVAEYLVVEFDVPLAFPSSSAAPSTRRVFLANDFSHGESLEIVNDKLGVLEWFIKHHLNLGWHATHVFLVKLHQHLEYVKAFGSSAKAQDLQLESDESVRFTSSWFEDELLPLGNEEEQEEEEEENEITSDASQISEGKDALTGATRKLMWCFENSTNRCFLCGTPLEVESMRMTQCTSELCTFTIEKLGLGVDVLAEATRNPEVFELLMLLAYASIANGEKRDVFVPMCNVDVEHLRGALHFRGPSNFYQIGSDKKLKNYRLLLETIQQVPPISKLVDLAENSNATLKRKLDAVNPLMYPFIQWVFSSNRSLLQPIPPLYQVAALGAHQFLLAHHPEKEKVFRKRRADIEAIRGDKNGSFYCWHGSGTYNWHSILREGLRVLSGTKFMSSGQVYGAGIYLARNITTSLPYSSVSKGSWQGSEAYRHPQGYTVLALCEVVNDPAVYKDHNGDILTVMDEDVITTRFLFILPFGSLQSSTIAASIPSNADIASQLRAAFYPVVF